MDDAVAKDKELNQLCEFIERENKALEHDYVSRKELNCIVDIITESINDLKQEIQQLRQDILLTKQQKREHDVVVNQDDCGKIKVEYFSDLRKTFVKFKR